MDELLREDSVANRPQSFVLDTVTDTITETIETSEYEYEDEF